MISKILYAGWAAMNWQEKTGDFVELPTSIKARG